MTARDLASTGLVASALLFPTVVLWLSLFSEVAIHLSRRRGGLLLLFTPSGFGLTHPAYEARVGDIPVRVLQLAGCVIIVLIAVIAEWINGRERMIVWGLVGAGPVLLLFLPIEVGRWRCILRSPARGLPGLSRWRDLSQFDFESREENVYRMRIARGFWFPRIDCELTLDPLAFQTLVQAIRNNSAAPIMLDGRELSTSS
jgi:hypothetical protein